MHAVEALREVAAQVGKKDWDFSVDPCSNESSWLTPMSDLRPLYNNSLICHCSYPAGVCHVVQLYVTLHFPYIEIVNMQIKFLFNKKQINFLLCK
jgi:hypothetical protein